MRSKYKEIVNSNNNELEHNNLYFIEKQLKLTIDNFKESINDNKDIVDSSKYLFEVLSKTFNKYLDELEHIKTQTKQKQTTDLEESE